MTTIVDVSSKLGEYLLKGWVLTDKICQKCSKVPLMRSPSTPTVHFCVNCDGDPPQTSAVSQASASTTQSKAFSEGSSTASMVSTSHESRSSTPLTELSSALSSPTFAPPFDTAELLRRRQQSDNASAEIGKRLLKGWAMLADECPNPQCYGVPLVRPPRRGPEKDPRKECVICHTVYVDQIGADGSQRLITLQSSSPPVPSHAASSHVIQSESSEDIRLAVSQPLPRSSPSLRRTEIDLPSNTSLQDLGATAAALEQSLRALTEKLNFFSSGSNVDASLIGQTADAISKVSQALMHVKQLHWSERQALGS